MEFKFPKNDLLFFIDYIIRTKFENNLKKGFDLPDKLWRPLFISKTSIKEEFMDKIIIFNIFFQNYLVENNYE